MLTTVVRSALLGSTQSLTHSCARRISDGAGHYEVAPAPESLAADIKEPHDRIEAVPPGLEAMGIKIVVGGYPLGEYYVLIIIQGTLDDTTAVSVALAVTACGAVLKTARTTRPPSGQEWIESLRKAQGAQDQPGAAATPSVTARALPAQPLRQRPAVPPAPRSRRLPRSRRRSLVRCPGRSRSDRRPQRRHRRQQTSAAVPPGARRRGAPGLASTHGIGHLIGTAIRPTRGATRPYPRQIAPIVHRHQANREGHTRSGGGDGLCCLVEGSLLDTPRPVRHPSTAPLPKIADNGLHCSLEGAPDDPSDRGHGYGLHGRPHVGFTRCVEQDRPRPAGEAALKRLLAAGIMRGHERDGNSPRTRRTVPAGRRRRAGRRMGRGRGVGADPGERARGLETVTLEAAGMDAKQGAGADHRDPRQTAGNILIAGYASLLPIAAGQLARSLCGDDPSRFGPRTISLSPHCARSVPPALRLRPPGKLRPSSGRP